MSIDPTLLELAIELAASYDPTLDTSEGSAFRTQFLNPLLTRVGGSALDGDIETFLVERLQTEIPGIDVSPLSAMRDLVVRAAVVMLTPLRREINAVNLRQSLNSYNVMTRGELNALLANYFTQLQEGSIATGTVRMYFPSPRTVTVTPLVQFSTGSGLNFFPPTTQSLTSVQMSFNQEGSLYYMDVQLEAEIAGEQYNVDVGEINTAPTISGTTKITNLARFTSGTNEETKEEGIARTQMSITVRNLITDRGVKFVIPDSFPAVDTLQVIGYGDTEMQRDVVRGPVSISDIPGGLTGKDDPDLLAGDRVHIGGKTDVYVYQSTPDSDDVDIQDFTDKGFRIFAGIHGYTTPGSPTATFNDDYGFFDRRGVAVGDLLYLGDTIYEISAFTSTTLTVISFNGGPSTISPALYELTYEICRRVVGQLTVPLYDLVAESDGVPVIDEDDDPIAPIPGSSAKAQLTVSSTPVKKKDLPWSSISRTNIKLPLLRILVVEKLDPISLEGSGVYVPMRDFFLATVPDDFTGGTISSPATGIVRVYFRDAVSAWVTRGSTRFHYNSLVFKPVAETQGSAYTSTASGTSGGNNITLTGANFTPGGLNLVKPGYRLEILSGPAAGTYTVRGGAYVGPDTVLTIREDLPATFSGVDWLLHVGTNPSEIVADTTLNLYYFDVAVECLTNGTNGNLITGSNFRQVDALTSEGWSLKTTKAVVSFSTRELPYLQLSEWVDDDTYIGDPLDAYAFRVSYEYAGSLVDIQAFADSPTNRIVGEDVLIKHFLPAYVRTVATVRDIAATDAKDRIVAYVNALSPTKDLETSDLIADLYEGGCTKVQMPMYLSYYGQNIDRSWTGLVSQDSLGSARIQHFIADFNGISVTVG